MPFLRCLRSAIGLLFVAMLFAACLPKTGHISWRASDEVEEALAQSPKDNLRYYYSGPEAIPHTIIGIREDVPFCRNFWQPAEFGEVQVREWLENIDNPHRDVTDMYFAGRLFDRKGEYLGIWYSKYHFYSGYINSEGKLVIQRPVRRVRRGFFNFLSK